MSTNQSVDAETIPGLSAILSSATSSARDPETMRKAREEMNRMREELRKRIGTVEVAVDLIREARNQ